MIKPLNALGQGEKLLGLYTAMLQAGPPNTNTQANYRAGGIYLNRKRLDKAARYCEHSANS